MLGIINLGYSTVLTLWFQSGCQRSFLTPPTGSIPGPEVVGADVDMELRRLSRALAGQAEESQNETAPAWACEKNPPATVEFPAWECPPGGHGARLPGRIEPECCEAARRTRIQWR